MAQKKQKQENPYWLDRGIKQEKKINDAAQQVEQKVISAYRQAQSYLTRQARNLFSRAKQRSGMDEEETRALLNQTVQPDELVELRKLADDVSNPDLQTSARKRLNGLAFKERITRAEDLKVKSFLVSKQIADVQLSKSTDFYIDVIHDSYNEATAEAVIQQIEQAKNDSIINVWNGQKYDSQIETFRQAKKRGVPVEVWNDPKNRSTDYEFKELSTKYTKNILDSHWHGSNYSKRIWNDTEALAKRLEELFTVESMTGMSEFEMAKAIAKEFDRSIGVAQRLIRTEANYMANQAKLKAWRDRGVKEYRLIAVLDFRTSKICQGKDGKVYLVYEAVVNGVAGTYPPFHPWCRTIAVAYIGKRSLTGKRTANDPLSGKTMTIEQRDTYNDWMKKLKQKYSDVEIEIQKEKIINQKKDSKEFRNLKKYLDKDERPRTLADYQETKYDKDETKWESLKEEYSLNKKAEIDTVWKNEIEGVSSNTSDFLNETHKKLFKQSRKKGKEKLVLIDKEKTKIVYEKEGSHNKVQLDNDVIKLLKDAKPNSYILSHNHPGSYPSSFSMADILNVFDYKSIQALTLETSTADRYVLDRRNANFGLLGKLGFSMKYDKGIGKLIGKHGEIDASWPKISHENNMNLAKTYKYHYKKVK